MGREPRTESPSDLGPDRSGEVLTVGGRVTKARGRSVTLGDALATLRVRLRAPSDVRPGRLLVVRGRLTGGELVDAELLEQHPGDLGAAEWPRLSTEGVGRALRARATALSAVRRYFDAQGFVEVETPVRVRSPGLDSHVDAFRAEGGFLITSPELHMKRLLVGGMPRVYQISRVSRIGELGRFHEPEFSMLEWYRAFSDQAATMADTEAVVRLVAQALCGEPRVRRGRRSLDLAGPFERLTVREAFRRHAGVADAVDLAATDEDRYFQLYVDRVEPALTRARRPLFLVDYPATQGALARPRSDDPSVVERYELFLFGVELCNGYGELTDATEQRRRFLRERARRRQTGARQQPSDEKFLAALGEGLPPCSGNALGLDRLLAVVLGLGDIAGAIAFPESAK